MVSVQKVHGPASASPSLDDYVRNMMERKLVHEVHQSELRSFRSCRRRWNWVFRDNYYPPLTIHYLEFGVAFHIAMEVIHRPETWKFEHKVLGALAEKAFVDECQRQKKAYLDAKDLYALEDDKNSDYEDRMALGRGMIWYYVKNKLPEMQQTYVPVAVETSFDVPLLDNGEYMFCKCKRCRSDFVKAGGGKWRGNPVVYSGRTDMIVHDMRSNYYILDWKSAAAFREIEEYLELDTQVGCVPLESEILTRTGWKTHDQLVIGEEILGYNDKKDCLEWTSLDAVHRYKSVDTIEVSSKSFKYVTTPNHKWAKRWQDGTFRLERLNWKTQAAHIVLSAELDSPTLDITEDEAAVIAWILTDGCISIGPRGVQATISQSKYVEEVRALLNRFENAYSRESTVPAAGKTWQKETVHTWHLRAPFWRNIWSRAGLDLELNGWEQFVLNLSAKARKAFCTHGYLAEGSIEDVFRGPNGQLFDTAKKFHQNLGCVNDMFRLAFYLTGKYPTVQNSKKKCEQFVVSEPRKWINPIRWSDAGKRDVWCPQTGLGTWVMRQNRQIVLTGNSYVMALRRKLGLNIMGFIYFELRKGFPEPPKMNTNPRLGRWFSVNKQQTTDYDTYLATIKEHDKEGYESGAYDGFLAWLKASGPQFFRKTSIPKSDYELDQVEKNLVLEVRDMLEPGLRIYPAPSQFSCSSCAFSLPCRMKNSGEDYQYLLDTMYEKREPYFRIKTQRFSTESRGGE